MKKLLILAVAFIIIFNNTLPVSASNEIPASNMEEFVRRALDNSESLKVIADDTEITTIFINIYNNQGIEAACDYLDTFDYCTVEYCLEERNPSMISPFVVLRAQTFTNYKYFTGYDKNNKYKKEWQTKMTGTYRYNVATDEVVSASSPSLSLYIANFGNAFSPYIAEVSTNSVINKSTNKITFYANYHMYSEFVLNYEDFEVGATLDYGTHNHTYIKE